MSPEDEPVLRTWPGWVHIPAVLLPPLQTCEILTKGYRASWCSISSLSNNCTFCQSRPEH